ncbi:MAG: hypothetical protein Q9226_004028, partial [Calogaya cf. arnoldii]
MEHTWISGHNVTTSQVAAVGAQMAYHSAKTQNKIEDRFDELEIMIEDIGDVDSRFDDLEAKVDEVDRIVDNRLENGETDERKTRHTGQPSKALGKKMAFQSENLRVLSHNALCTEGWQYVLHVCRPGSEGRILSPLHPYTVRSFWKLKDVAE